MSRDKDTSLDGNFGAASIDDKVNRLEASVLDIELLHHGLRVSGRVLELGLALERLGREVGVRRSILLRELETAGKDVDRDDTGGTEGLCNGHAEQADGTSAKNDDLLVCTQTTEIGDGVNSDGEGLHLG